MQNAGARDLQQYKKRNLMKKLRVTVLGAGFGGLELSTILSEKIGDRLDLTLIDKNDSFVFGFSKLDVMFGHEKPDAVRLHYRHISKPGVRFRQEAVTSIDAQARRVTTDKGTYEADILVIALGADYDFDATPGLIESGDEFYSFAGAKRLAEKLPKFSKGRVVIGVSGTPFKCPPAPSETALMLHDYLTKRGVRKDCEITFAIPFGVPIPPSPETSQALLKAFAERNIAFVPKKTVTALDGIKRVVMFDDNTTLPYDLYMGVPKHCVPQVVADSGLTQDGWMVPSVKNLKMKFPGVYAVGDVTRIGPPKAGFFAEGAARVAALSILADLEGGPQPADYDGAGTCYLEFGGGKVGRVDVNFLSGPTPTGRYFEPSTDLVAEKKLFGSSRRARWFGLK
jgi:sulfide:quinone oxidoreductase